MCQQTVLKFPMSLRETFSTLISLRLIGKMIKTLFCKFWVSLGPLNVLIVDGCSKTDFCTVFSDHLSRSM